MKQNPAWPAERLPEGLSLLARRSGIARPRQASEGLTAAPLVEYPRLVEDAADLLGLEAQPVEVEYADLAGFLEQAPPLIVRRGGRYHLIAPGGERLSADGETDKPLVEDLLGLLEEETAAPVQASVDRVVHRAGLSGKGRRKGSSSVAGRNAAGKRVGGCWLLRSDAKAAGGGFARLAGLRRWVAGFFAGLVGEYVFWLGSWWLLGWLSLTGRFDSGWLSAWVLLVLGTAPCRLVATLCGGQLAVHGGALFKERLLAATLSRDGDEVRRQGVGQLLGRVLEAESIETHLLEGAQFLATGVLESLLAGLVLTVAALSSGGRAGCRRVCSWSG